MTTFDHLTTEELQARKQIIGQAGSALGVEGVELPEAATQEYERIVRELERRQRSTNER